MPTTDDALSPSQLIDSRIEELGDWRGDMLARIRALIHQAVSGGRSTCTRAMTWTRPRSVNWCVQRQT